MIFAIFLKMAILIMALFVKKIENHMKGEFVKIEEFTLVIIFVIFLQNVNLGLKKESFEVSRNSA